MQTVLIAVVIALLGGIFWAIGENIGEWIWMFFLFPILMFLMSMCG